MSGRFWFAAFPVRKGYRGGGLRATFPDVARADIPEADALLDIEHNVLDHGFVRLVDYMGGDQRIVQSARVSYGEGTKGFRKDEGLIRYLLRNEHTSPFEQVILTFHVKLPIFVARQWVRHRTARLNEISGRYSIISHEYYIPEEGVIARQSRDNKQGRETEPVSPADAAEVRTRLVRAASDAFARYDELLQSGIARELARVGLPLSTYTEWYWQIDLHNLFHFLKLRLDPHAQYEIRAYGEVLFTIAKAVAPIACAAFEDYILGSHRFAKAELAAVRALLAETDENRIREAGAAQGLEGKALDRLVDAVRGP